MAGNGGFGLNYNSGFGTGAYYGPSGPDPNQQYAWQGYNQQAGQGKQQAFQAGQNALDRNQSLAQQQAGLAEQERQSSRSADVAKQGYASQQQIANIQADAAKYAPGLQQQRFDTVEPYLINALQGFGGTTGSGGSTAAYTGQGQVGTAPQIDATGVYTPAQIQQQVNGTRAQNDQQTAGQVRQTNQKLAGQGYGTNSPLAQALGMGLQSQNLATNTGAEQQLRFNAAGANASQLLQGQQAQEAQFANRQQEDIERNKTRASQYSALLGVLGNIV